MYNTGIENVNNSTNFQAIIIDNKNYTNQHTPLNNSTNKISISNPTCIVIGCKNGGGISNPSVKYYQVPNFQTNIKARQWYINTLREDLLENLQINNQKALIQSHHVCIEHFDEESFIIDNSSFNSQQQVMILKDDAVPSLFELEVFQKMIAHQEQITLNQQKQLAIKQQQQIVKTQQQQPSSLLSSLILSEQPTVLTNSVNNRQSSKTSNNVQNNNNNNSLNKRPRIDPDVRAALIQRVPKAVKRTSVMSLSNNSINDNDNLNQQKFTDNSVAINNTRQLMKLPKALKQTMPRNFNIIEPNQTQQNNIQTIKLKSSTSPTSINNTTGTTKNHKAVKHTTPFLKDIPPPIMQSTKRPTLNKALKQTSGLAQSFAFNYNNKPIDQISNLNTVDLSPSTSLLNSLQNNQNNSNNNKITITTTYVYKRVSQQPDIDLELECEEEEYIYIKSISPPPSPLPVSPKKFGQASNTSKIDEIKKKSNNDNQNKINNENHELISEPESISSSDTKSNKTNKKSNKKVPTSDSSSSATTLNNVFMNVLSKYYSRRQGSYSTENKSLKKSQLNKLVPTDLRIGNYPAQCNVCDMILENNIELTSHICSHLESNGNDPNSLSSYISPFDAVTTTCGVCDETFFQPFELIKHLDIQHMKQLDEYKCRICEKQHTKLTDLITHLSQTHSHDEMPYKCDACGFRTSFYADAIYHIKKEHTSTLRHFCPYCLKSLVLPFNQKLGHVQCNLFYSHLETHFNKQENNVLLPSKCKHCSKCILHVRNMKDHLLNDHNDISNLNLASNMTTNLKAKSQDNKKYTDKRKRKRSIIEEENESIVNYENSNSILSQDDNENDEENLKNVAKSSEKKSKLNTSSTLSEVKIEKEDIDIENSNSIDVYDFEKNVEAEQTKLKGRRSSINKKSLVINNETSSIISGSTPATKTSRKPKALKQTNKKNSSARRASRSSRTLSSDDNIPINENDGSEEKVVSTFLLGNLKFSCQKREFKCIECGGLDMKCHFRNEYTCHQCYYNTSCSKSFEYHLHGHLVSKRLALWNKKIKSESIEVYNCPCGFKINSSLDNNSNGDTGNKVAAHLIQCEYKYCNYQKIDKIEEENVMHDDFPETKLENVQQKN